MKKCKPRHGLLLSCCLATLLINGGCFSRNAQPPQRPAYFGSTESLAQIARKIDQNNQRLSTLWCRFSYDITLRDPQTRKTDTAFDDDGKLLYRAPAEFRLLANKTAFGRILDLGMNDERFWLIATPPKGEDQMWWGDVDADSPVGSSDIPVRPESLLQVLAVSTFNADFSTQPAPVLRFNNDTDMYMLVWVQEAQGRFVAVREVWYDRATLQPALVLLFDANGRVVLRAKLSDHQEVPADARPGPKIATRYDIWFPDSGSKMVLTLRELSLTHNDAPNDASFRFPGFGSVPESKAKRIDGQEPK